MTSPRSTVILLAGTPAGKYPLAPGRVGRCLTDRRSLALILFASRNVLGHRPSLRSGWRSTREAVWQGSGGHQGRIGNLTGADCWRVDQ